MGAFSRLAFKQDSQGTSNSQQESLVDKTPTATLIAKSGGARKTAAMPLSVLLSRAESHSKRRANNSKTRSIAEKQLSFEAATRL